MGTLRTNSKTNLLGYHDKSTNKVGLMDQDQLPMLIDENYAPFLTTRDHNFVIATHEIKSMIQNFAITKNFRKIKNNIASILLIPGLIISIGYILKLFGFFDDISLINNIFSNKLLNMSFWIAVLGILVLWHDTYRNEIHPIQLPQSPLIPEKEIDQIKTYGFKFTRYVELGTCGFVSEELQQFLAANTHEDNLNSLRLFNELLKIEEIERIIKRSNLDLNQSQYEKYDISKATIPDYPLTAVRCLLTYALQEAILTKSPSIQPAHIFLAYFKVFPILKKYLQSKNSSIEIMREVERYYQEEKSHNQSVSFFNPKTKYYRTGGIGRDWIYGWTYYLGKFSTDLTQEIIGVDKVFGIGHEKEVEAIVSIIGRLSKKNILLIGEAGTGKSSLIKGLAQRINLGNVPPQIQNKRIIQLDLTQLLALSSNENNGGSSMGDQLKRALDELAKAGNTILYIDEIQEIIPAKSESTGQSIASIVLPYILEGKFPVIGTINYSDYKKYFYSNESLRQGFENVEVAELSPRDTMYIIESQIDQLEENFKLYITFPAITASIELAQRYISSRKLPDSAVRVIEASCSWAQSQNIKVLTNEHVSKYISIQTNIPVESITAEEATRLMNLEQNIKSRVIGQDEAVHAIVESLKRSRTDVRDPNKPIGVFLFLGPTGTGKTHLAKVISEEYFGSKSDIIRIDMSEYQDIKSIDKLLGVSGSTDTLSQQAISLLDRVKSNPYTVVLFDEIEKAHPQILDLFLQLFDEGRLTSNSGETVNFTNTIIISTSNIGSRLLLEALQKDRSLWEEAKGRAIIELRQAIRPELLNRFDGVIVFAPHTIQNLIKITEILLNEMAKRMLEKSITLKWDNTIPMIIADKAQEPGLGARPLKRFIQEKIEGKLATEIISGNIKNGDTVDIRESWLN